MTTIIPKFTARVALPAEIRIPVAVAIQTGLPRQIRLTHGMGIPAAVAEFMLSDPRYRDWFSENPLQSILSETPAVTDPIGTETPAVTDPIGTETPAVTDPIGVEAPVESPKKRGKA